MPRGIREGDHRWGITIVSNDPVEKCEHCGLLKRIRIAYVKGELMRSPHKIAEYFVGGVWRDDLGAKQIECTKKE